MKNFDKKKIPPPYPITLDTERYGRQLVICTGSNAWNRAISDTWYYRGKVVLPFREDPDYFDWSAAAGHDALVCGFGELEPINRIAQLASLLLAAGANLVLYAPERGNLIRIEAREAAA